MEAVPDPKAYSESCIQLLLFVDKRPRMREKIRQVRDFLAGKTASCACELRVIDVSEQPYLVEHFKLVATPALIKLHPAPRQVLAGENLLEQIDNWWFRWQQAIADYLDVNSHRISTIHAHGQGNTVQSTSSVLDEAELIKLSDDLFQVRQENEELRAQVSFKDRLIAMLAHDLRNPLTALSIALETLEMQNVAKINSGEAKLSPDLSKQLLKHARTQAKAIDRMITDVLQAAQSSDAQFRIYPVPLNLREAFHDTLNRLERQFQAKTQQIKTDIPQDLPEVYADPERVQQLLVNLLDNATKYTPVGGTIEVTALHRTTQKVQVSIGDNGPGIPSENQEKIFEDRFRLTRDKEKDGYGIGLSLCQRIVRAHYGQIWVDSLPGQGSTFHFTLPVYRS